MRVRCRTVVTAVLVFAAGSGAGVATSAAPAETTEGAVRLSLDAATARVRAFIFAETPTMNSTSTFPLKEVTTEEIWAQLGAQVFRVTDGLRERVTYLIAGDEVVELGIATGWPGVTSMKVTDLDRDGAAELTFTFAWGSGLHRSEVGMYSPSLPAPHTLGAKASFTGEDWILEGSDDQVFLTVSPPKGAQSRVRIGRLALWREATGPRLGLDIDKELPQKFREQLWTAD